MKKIYLFFALFFACVCSFDANGQNQRVTIRGTVYFENPDGQMEKGIGSIVCEDTDPDITINATMADEEGNYTIRVANPDCYLIASYLGYYLDREYVGQRRVIDFYLYMMDLDE